MEPVDNKVLDWKEDDVKSSSIVDAWPCEEHIKTIDNSSIKMIKFAHEEFPLERPPITCRLIFETVPPMAIDDQKETSRTAETTDMYNDNNTIDLDRGRLTSHVHWFRHRSYAVTPLPLSLTKSTSHDALPYKTILACPFKQHTYPYLGSSTASATSMEDFLADGKKNVLSSLVSWWKQSSSRPRFFCLKSKITPFGSNDGRKCSSATA